MIKRRKFPKIFFGWWTVLASGIICLWGAAPYHYGMSALFKPISSELGFSRLVTSIPTAIGRMEGGFEAALAGWSSDRFGARSVVLFGVFCIGLSLVLMNYIGSVWSFYVVWGVILGTGTNITIAVALDKAIVEWFVKKRGKALGTKWAFSGFSGVLVLPLIAWLITVQGWRMTCVICGVVMWAIGLPLAWFFFKRHRPEYYGLLPDGATTKEATEMRQTIDRGVEYATEAEEVEFTLRQAMKTRTFWMQCAAHASSGVAMAGFNVHCIPFLTDIGIEPVWAAGMMAIYVFAGIPFRFIGGIIADRLKKDRIRFLLSVGYLLQAMGFAVFLLTQTIAMIYIWFVLYGIGNGLSIMFTAMTARYFGRKAYGSIQGTRQMLMTPFSVASPIYMGWVYDTTGSYLTAFVVVTVMLALSTVIMFFTSPPKPPDKITDVRKIV